jgi:hypothetical protein
MYLKYLKNLLRHKWFVFVECCRLGIPWLGIVHDLSKFLPSEWLPYARYFYGKWPTEEEADRQFPFGTVLTKEKVAAQFDVAWLHHQHRNKHHWLRWLLTLDSARSDGKLFPVAMPDRYRREMLADWRGAGRAYGTPDTRFWYLVNRDKMQLHPETRAWVEEQLGIHDWLAGTREPIVVPLRRRRGLCLWWAKLKTLPRHYEIGRIHGAVGGFRFGPEAGLYADAPDRAGKSGIPDLWEECQRVGGSLPGGTGSPAACPQYAVRVANPAAE